MTAPFIRGLCLMCGHGTAKYGMGDKRSHNSGCVYLGPKK